MELPENDKEFRTKRSRLAEISAYSWVVSVVVHLIVILFSTLVIVGGDFQIGQGAGEVLASVTETPADSSQEESLVEILLPEAGIVSASEMELEVQPVEVSDLEPLEADIGDIVVEPIAAFSASVSSEKASDAGSWGEFAASQASSSGGGASFFGIHSKGNKFVFVVDRSGSMGNEPIASAKQELIRSIKRLPEGAEFFVIFYSSTHVAMPAEGLVSATNRNKESCFDWIESIEAGGSTNPTSAMKMAIELRPSCIWLLSDGVIPQSSINSIKEANSKRKIPIHTIAFLSDKGQASLRKIATENRGKFRYVKSPVQGR